MKYWAEHFLILSFSFGKMMKKRFYIFLKIVYAFVIILFERKLILDFQNFPGR